MFGDGLTADVLVSVEGAIVVESMVADKVPETFASTVAFTARSWATFASTVASILGVGSAGTGVIVEHASTRVPITIVRATVSFISR